MNIEAAFPSKYLKAADLQGKTVRVTIRTVLMEAIGQGNNADQRPILYFQGKEKGLVLNKTNATTISTFYGPDTDDWTGRDLELFSVMTDYQGRPVEGLRVRIPRLSTGPTQQRQPEPPPATPESYGAMIDDEIPF